MPLRFAILFFISIAMGLVGCAGNKTVVLSGSGSELSKEAPRDSLRAKFLLTLVNADGSTQELDAVLFAVPGKRYRMELTGPLGIGLASLLWTEKEWLVTFPTEKLYVKGSGYMVGLLNDKSLPLVHIHQVADLFNGVLLPEGYEVAETKGDSTWAREKTGRSFVFAKDEGRVLFLTRPGRDGRIETLRFYDFKEFEGVATPSRIVFERDGSRFLEIRIKKVNRNKPFSLGTWRLNIPKSFKKVGE